MKSQIILCLNVFSLYELNSFTLHRTKYPTKYNLKYECNIKICIYFQNV